jgi:hypothetical protein
MRKAGRAEIAGEVQGQFTHFRAELLASNRLAMVRDIQKQPLLA